MRNHHFSIDNLASANPSFGEELYSRSFLVDVIDSLIAWSIKDTENNRKYMPQLFLIASVKASFMRTRVVSREHHNTNRNV